MSHKPVRDDSAPVVHFVHDPAPDVPSKCGKALFRQSRFNGMWYKIWEDEARPSELASTAAVFASLAAASKPC